MELKELLDDYDVEYWTEGKNVSKGWINVQCPFCDDESNHLGLSVTDLTASCWKCGKKNIINVIKTVCDISYKEAKGLFDNLESSEIEYRKTKSDGLRIDTKVFENNFVMIPEGATKILPKLHRDYLRKRRFNYRLIQRKYKIQAVYTTGDYSFRIIIPIYKNNQLVSFTSRDVTKYADLRYRHASQEECILRPKDLIYGYDDIEKGGDAILVEGVFDKWRLGKKAICGFGTHLSGKQIVELNSMRLRNLFIFYDQDPGGQSSAKLASKMLAPLVRSIEIIKIPKFKGDPADLSKEKAELIMRSLDLKG